MAKSKNILSLGFEIPTKDPNVKISWDFDDEFISLSDYDFVIFSPYIGEDASDYWAYRKYWRDEINSFLSRGGVLFVVLDTYCEYEEYYAASKVTVSNYEILPTILEYKNTKGNKLSPKSAMVSEFFSTFKDRLEYRVSITGKQLQQTFTTAKGDKILGGIVKHKEGYIVFLPTLDLFCETSDDYTPEELKLGQQFLTCLSKIYDSLHGVQSEAPKWVSDGKYMTKKGIEMQQRVAEIQANIHALNSEKEMLIGEIHEEASLSALLYETGKPLEKAVSKALYIMGYTEAENYSDGVLELDQVIISPEGDRFIGECEGKDKSDISVDKFRQLQDSIQEDFARDEVDTMAMGLLFGNPHRLTEPEKRTSFFTEKCTNNAKRAGIALIKTTDLFEAARFISDSGDMEYARICREAIKEQLGKVVEFPRYNND